jgi:hypothetical protein
VETNNVWGRRGYICWERPGIRAASTTGCALSAWMGQSYRCDSFTCKLFVQEGSVNLCKLNVLIENTAVGCVALVPGKEMSSQRPDCPTPEVDSVA